MEFYYLFSNCMGTFCFNEKCRLIDALEFDLEKSISTSYLLERGAVLDSERRMISKIINFKNTEKNGKVDFQIVVLGKNIKYAERLMAELGQFNDKIRCEDDKEIILKLIEFFKSKRYTNRFCDINLALTRKGLKESISPDIVVIQIVNCVEELNRSANLLSKRLREWYELYCPEVSKSIPDNKMFAKRILEKNRAELLKDLKMTPEQSAGADLKEGDLSAIEQLAEMINSINTAAEKQTRYLEWFMKEHFPNITNACGASIGAKILAIAGSLDRLAEMPSSKIQVLGAEKALFRHLRTGAKPPKYGIISQHQSIAAAAVSERGRAARKLSSRIAIAARIDFFRKKKEEKDV